jgi:site-specific DNA recombinase
VPAPEIEQLVLDGLRSHLQSAELPAAIADRDLIDRHVDRVIVGPQAVEVRLITSGSTEPAEPAGEEPAPGELATTTLTLPWMASNFVAVKGIVHEPSTKSTMNPETRDTLLAAIAKARGWIEDLRLGRVATFAEIADRESHGERHVRLLAPLAFVAPRIVAAIADGNAPADLTVTGLAQGLPHSWSKQERRFADTGTAKLIA